MNESADLVKSYVSWGKLLSVTNVSNYRPSYVVTSGQHQYI